MGKYSSSICSNYMYDSAILIYIHTHRNQIEGVVDIKNMCNSKCGCSSGSYEPICAKNGIQYFSACHGGCLSDTTGADDIKVIPSVVIFTLRCCVYEAPLILKVRCLNMS